jgi:hypothetical protein
MAVGGYPGLAAIVTFALVIAAVAVLGGIVGRLRLPPKDIPIGAGLLLCKAELQ